MRHWRSRRFETRRVAVMAAGEEIMADLDLPLFSPATGTGQ
jgi:hypothetical protein